MKNASLSRIIKDIKNYLELEKESGIDELIVSNPLRDKRPKGLSTSLQTQDKTQALEELRQIVLNCNECELYELRRNSVFGSGSTYAELMFVGEAPGIEEDIQGLPFVGKAGTLLTKMVEAMGLRRDDIYITNTLKCRPPQNRNPFPSEIIACREFLLRQIDIIRPKVICCLGKFSAQTLLMSEEPITKLRGKFYELERIKVMPTFHPAYLLRNPDDKRLAWQDLKKVRDYLKSQIATDKS